MLYSWKNSGLLIRSAVMTLIVIKRIELLLKLLSGSLDPCEEQDVPPNKTPK